MLTAEKLSQNCTGSAEEREQATVRSRFPSGMTERKARAKAKAEAKAKAKETAKAKAKATAKAEADSVRE